ncbi:NADH:flavin oxidoreductase/NADH oxidase [Pseudofulvimonas gallinarii]|uniref:2,4-dienoyl-CoA reductase-like NADH-dependent reductase (Old Yellow Enzyme family) n=1 Tax=Pseudofulvimonas gallinarii TaxID=634155 RepID=A0A4R3LM64_9GAMM|nr:NADH:flavin oxidoreductase/NADH oxidase [Pseudofulvimonas gallinarii]TCS99684.1 2,4-dienoyl-CoA reductase-like NADH-dependent reductase (Old Yellow Enzyme family) [Pseudofulvimonas gallinarii]THD15279.1 oxidoreductase [Pseudofulvimonas gallinarii]
MSLLFSPLDIGPLALPNRIVIAPMCQYAADHGEATDWHRIHLGHLALSGAGLLIVEATAVEPRGRITWADLGLWDNRTEGALAAVLEGVRRYSPMPLGIQLAHAGRKASCNRPWEQRGAAIDPNMELGWQTVSASCLPFKEGDPAPTALAPSDIDGIIEAFAASARRAVDIGFGLIEIHAAHGYLLHQFLSPLSNRRDDDFGGAAENRMRLALRVFDAVKSAVPAGVAVGLRISATDWVDGGWDVAQSIALARELDARGCHFLHVSSGGLDPRQQIPVAPGYQVPMAAAIRREVDMPVIAVGLITEPRQAEDILASGHADAVALARGFLWNPRWPWHAAAALDAQAWAPPNYLRSAPSAFSAAISP